MPTDLVNLSNELAGGVEHAPGALMSASEERVIRSRAFGSGSNTGGCGLIDGQTTRTSGPVWSLSELADRKFGLCPLLSRQA